MPSAQRPVGSGFDATTTAADVLEGIDLTGRLAVVTGGYSGIGLETTRALAGAGARVVVPARRPAAAAEALAGIDGVEIDELDLGDLDSVAAFAERFLASGRRIDLLIDNAGIMACPETRVGPGWEAQFATNHLGHFALVNRLWPAIADVGARVVSVSSIGHRRSRIRWDDVQFEHGYDKWTAYGQAKTANVLFAVHLDTLGAAAGVRAFSLHPGGILTPLQRHLRTEEMVAFGWIDEDGNPIGPGFKTPEQGAATTGVGGDVTTARRHRRRLLRGLRCRRALRRSERSSWGAQLGDRPGRGGPAVGAVVLTDRRRRTRGLNARLWSVSAGVGCFARCLAMMTRRLNLCPAGLENVAARTDVHRDPKHALHRQTPPDVCRMGSWRAGCGESRTSGSEGGPEKPTNRKVDRALWPDPYCRSRATSRSREWALDGYLSPNRARKRPVSIPGDRTGRGAVARARQRIRRRVESDASSGRTGRDAGRHDSERLLGVHVVAGVLARVAKCRVDVGLDRLDRRCFPQAGRDRAVAARIELQTPHPGRGTVVVDEPLASRQGHGRVVESVLHHHVHGLLLPPLPRRCSDTP